MMDDSDKTKKQLLAEIKTLRQQLDRLDGQANKHPLLNMVLRDDQDLAAAILDITASLVIVLDAEGRIALFNPACQRLTGYTFYEVKDLHVWDILLVPEEAEGVKDVFRSLRSGSFPNTHENCWLTKDGRRRLIAWSNTVLFCPQGRVAYVVGTGIDITEQKQAEEALQDEEVWTNTILETAVEGIVTIDVNGIIESFNPAAERLSGYRADEVIGRNVNILMTSPYRDEHDSYINAYLETGQPKVIGVGREIMIRRKDGTTLPAMLSVSESYLKKRRLFTGVLHDLSQLKQAEVEIRKADRLSLVGQLASGLAHEIGTPLNVIAGNAELLRINLKEQGLEVTELDTIITQADRITQLIEQLLTFASPNGDGRETTTLDVPLSHALQLLEPRFKREGISVILEVPDDLPLVRGSSGQLEQIFINVLVNAWHAMPEGGRVTVRVTPKDGQRLEVVFQDTGVGMTEEALLHAFEPFYSTKGKRGTGLGLAICRQILDGYGGHISLMSHKGEGTTVCIQLQYSALPDTKPAPVA